MKNQSQIGNTISAEEYIIARRLKNYLKFELWYLSDNIDLLICTGENKYNSRKKAFCISPAILVSHSNGNNKGPMWKVLKQYKVESGICLHINGKTP